jgi:mono/diheme cytochrome c family protein
MSHPSFTHRAVRIFLTVSIALLSVQCSHIQKTVVAIQGDPFPPTSRTHQIDVGRTVYTNKCTRCHGDTGLGDGSDARTLSSSPPNFSDGSYTKGIGLTAANILYGKGEMPAFGEKLSEEEIWGVAHFLHTLKDR